MPTNPIRLVIPRNTLAFLSNVVRPKDRVQSGVLSRFQLLFYRSNGRSTSRSFWVNGPRELFVGAPRNGNSWVASIRIWPLRLRFARLTFSTSAKLVKPFGLELQRIGAEYTLPEVPKKKQVLLQASRFVNGSKRIEVKRKGAAVELQPLKMVLDTRHEALFETNSQNTNLIKEYDAIRLF